MIYVKAVAFSSVHDLVCQDLRGLTMQNLDYLTGAQAVWLRILESCGYEGLPDGITIPDDELDALVEKGLVRRLRDGAIEITLGGIRAQH